MADLVLVVHFGFVLFILGGFVLIWAGFFRGWRWVRNFRFRMVHLAAMALVTLETILGITCPLTDLEAWLRNDATGYEKGFIAYWIHEWMFYSAPDYVFLLLYSGFLLLLFFTFYVVRPIRSDHTKSA